MAAPSSSSQRGRLRWVRTPEPHVALKEFGLRSLTALLRALSGPTRLQDAATERLLVRLAGLFESVSPGSLFPDWSPPAMVPEVPIVLKASDITADSERAPSHGGTMPAWLDFVVAAARPLSRPRVDASLCCCAALSDAYV